MKKQNTTSGGFTLLELMITSVISGIVVFGVTRFAMSVMWSFKLQEQISDMHMNADYTIQRLSEELMAAGTDLPEAKYDVITQNPGDYDAYTLKINLYGTFYMLEEDRASDIKVPCNDASALVYTDSLIKLDTANEVETALTIDRGHNGGTFVNGIDTESEPDSICLTTAETFADGDFIFSAYTYAYYLDGLNLCLNTDDNVLAENIDSLCIKFYDEDHNETTDWDNMRLVHCTVRTRTATSDNRYSHPEFHDGYRRVVRSMDFSLRNKF